MVKEDEIGNIYTVALNGMTFTATISQDPSQYQFYNDLGLDVFEKDEKTLIMIELDKAGVTYRKNSKLETLKDKLDDYTEGNG